MTNEQKIAEDLKWAESPHNPTYRIDASDHAARLAAAYRQEKEARERAEAEVTRLHAEGVRGLAEMADRCQKAEADSAALENRLCAEICGDSYMDPDAPGHMNRCPYSTPAPASPKQDAADDDAPDSRAACVACGGQFGAHHDLCPATKEDRNDGR